MIKEHTHRDSNTFTDHQDKVDFIFTVMGRGGDEKTYSENSGVLSHVYKTVTHTSI